MLKKLFIALLLVCAAASVEAKPKKFPHTRELVSAYYTQRYNGHELKLPGDEHLPLLLKLVAVAKAHGVRVGMAHLDEQHFPECPCWGITGFNRSRHALIVIEKEGLTVNEQVNAMAHELAHALAPTEMSHPDDDIYAEAVAYIVLAHFGFDTSYAVVAYYQNVLAGDDEFLILNGLGRLHKLIDATADAIIAEMEK